MATVKHIFNIVFFTKDSVLYRWIGFKFGKWLYIDKVHLVRDFYGCLISTSCFRGLNKMGYSLHDNFMIYMLYKKNEKKTIK